MVKLLLRARPNEDGAVDSAAVVVWAEPMACGFSHTFWGKLFPSQDSPQDGSIPKGL